MTYCAERTNLLSRAGRALAERLLPKPFDLYFSDHSTGRQMRIQAKGLTVWQGSVWHSPGYEFNDKGHHPGLQPDFEFARDAIEKYFADVQAAVTERDEMRASEAAARTEATAEQKRADIDAIRQQVAAS